MLVHGADPGPSATGKTEPLYLLTYDHGGLVLWGAEHFAERLRNAIAWLERYPHFKIGLDNEAYVYDELAEKNPAILDELRGYLRRFAGRFAIGTCTYGQPLSQFINEESNIRQLTYAIRAGQEHFGFTPKIYLMSEHAMHSQIPQLLVNSGFQGAIMRTHFMMYGYNPTYHSPIGWWIGLDGSRLPTVPTYAGEGAAFGKTTVDNWILTRYPAPDAKMSLDEFRQKFAGIHPLLASRADDSGLRKEELVRQCEGRSDYQWILLEELLALFPKPTDEYRTQPDDFVVRMPWGYCGNEIWNQSRQAEVQVLTAERLAALEFLLAGKSHEAELQKAWRNLLVGQHHDIQICGLLAEARKFLPVSLAASKQVRDEALAFFAQRMQGDGVLQITAFNPVSWARTEWLEAELSFTEKGKARSFVVRQGSQEIPALLLSAERYSDGSLMTARVGFAAELPGLGLRAFSLMPRTNTPGSQPRPAVEMDAKNLRIRTPFLEARLHPDGGLISLVDHARGRLWFKPDQRSGFFAGQINGEAKESHGRWLLQPAGESAPWVTAREEGWIGDIPYTAEMVFRAETPRIDCHVQFHFAGQKIGRVSDQPRDGASGFIHEQKLRFKFFPAVESEAIGVRDLPFAIAATTNRYVEGNYWTAITDRHTGVAIFNRGTMGLVRESDGGVSVPLAYAMNYIWGTRMLQGDFSYEFALYPFGGDWETADLHRRAITYNFPVQYRSGKPGNGTSASEVRLLEAGSERVILSALYATEGHVYARLYEDRGRPGQAPVRLLNGRNEIKAVNFLGQDEKPIANPAIFQPWQIRTFKIQ